LAIRDLGAKWRINENLVEEHAEAGYLKLSREWQAGDCLTVEIPLPIERVRAHPRVTSASGRVALKRGPVVYAVEEADHGAGLTSVGVKRETLLQADPDPHWGVTVLTGEATRETASNTLYQSDQTPQFEPTALRAIPYAWWGNRGEGEMRVWVRDYES
jgi:DUF1680 family protein